MEGEPAALHRGLARASFRTFYGWRMLALFWVTLAVDLGFTMYGGTIMNSRMAEEMHLSATALGGAFALFMAMIGLPAPLVAMLITRLGIRIPLVAGTLLVSLGAILMATVAHGALSATLIFGGVIGGGVVLGSIMVTQVGIGRWFVRRRSIALAILLSANAIGGLIAPPLLEWAIARSGDWRTGWLVLASIALPVAVIGALVARNSPSDVGQWPDGRQSEEEEEVVGLQRAAVYISAREFSVGEAVRTPALWIIMGAVIANYMALALVLSHAVPHLRSLGHSSATAAWAISLISGGTLAGKVLLGGVGDRIEPRLLWALSCMLIALGLFSAPFATSVEGLILFAIPFGMGFGGALVTQAVVIMNFFGLKPYAALLGITLLGQTLFSTIVPVAAGLLHDYLGSYLWGFLVVGGVSLIAALALLVLRPPLATPGD